MHTKEIKNRPADFYEKEEKENTKCNRKKTTKIYGKSCFHAAHEEAIRKAMKEEEWMPRSPPTTWSELAMFADLDSVEAWAEAWLQSLTPQLYKSVAPQLRSSTSL